MRRFHVVVAAASLLAGVSACGGDGKPTTDSTVAVAGNDTASKDSASAPSRVECKVAFGAGGCKHVLAQGWSQLPDPNLLTTLSKDIKWSNKSSKSVDRKYDSAKCTDGKPTQRLRASVESWNMEHDVTKWTPGLTMAMTKFEPVGSGKCHDEVYQVGQKKSDRDFYLLFTVANAIVQKPNGDTLLGTWQILSLDRKNPAGSRETVSSGEYVLCGHKHPPMTDATSEFQSCFAKARLADVAQKNNMTYESAFTLYDSLYNARTTTAASTPLSPLHASILATQPPPNYADAPAWTTCALGCCVAENPLKTDAGTRANKAAVAPQSTRRRLAQSALAPAYRSRKVL